MVIIMTTTDDSKIDSKNNNRRWDLIPGNKWHKMVETEYNDYNKLIIPRAAAVTYLIYSGVSYNGTDDLYYKESMCDSYANAFQVHQRPYKTGDIHKKWIRKLPYFWYLWLVALPVDIYVHTAQFFLGECGEDLIEGGGFFIPYMCSHWTLLSVSLVAPYVCNQLPEYTWNPYFRLLRYNLIVHEYMYRMTLRKMSLSYRLYEFGLFVLFSYMIYNYATH